jgi:glycosyltransferase involved in cell wall biosynthesis
MTSAQPRFSLIVPLQDEEHTVAALLQSINDQTRAPDELIIVDSGSRDRTAEIVRGFPARVAPILAATGRLGPGAARNEGVARASGDWLAFTDGGVRLDPTWLESIARAAGEGGADVLFGAYEPVCSTFFLQCAALAYVAPRDSAGFRGPSAASFALRRPVFVQTGGFPAYRAAEDLAFFDRLAQGGYRTAAVPLAIARWELASTVAATFRRFALYSEHNLRAGRGRHWHLGLARQYLALLALLAIALRSGLGWWSLALFPGLLLARAAKAAWTKRRSFDFASLHPGRLIGAAVLLAVIDAATWTGALHHLLRPRDHP